MTKNILGFICWQIQRIPGFYDMPANPFYDWALSWAGYYACLSDGKVRSRHLLRLRCYTLVLKDRRQASNDASQWLTTYCRHWATIGHDTMTIDNLNPAERIIARQHLGTLRRLGKLREGGFRGNFEVIA